MEKALQTKPLILPIASGKGGVGKSVLAANLAHFFARMGHRVVAVDLDLGASNLHTHLGLPNHYPGLGDYLKSGGMRFSDLLVKTGEPNLLFLPGDGRMPFMADITYEQRHILVGEIRKIPADIIILDLGAGSRFSTLHFFGLSRMGLLITSCETPAIMNMIVFLKNFMFRELSAAIRSHPQVVARVKEMLHRPGQGPPLTMDRLFETLKAMDPELWKRTRLSLSAIRPGIVFNMVDSPEDVAILPKVEQTLRQGLSLAPDFLGLIDYDGTVRTASRKKQVMLSQYPASRYTVCVDRLARNVATRWGEPGLSFPARGILRDMARINGRDMRQNTTQRIVAEA